MNRVRRFLVWLLTLSMLLVPALAGAETSIRLVVDGVEVQTDVPPVLEAGRVLVPVRAVAEALGFEVAWDQATRTATLTKGDKVIALTADKAEALVNGEVITLDVPATIRSDRMLVPVRFVAEQIGLNVDWDQETKTVSVASAPAAESEESAPAEEPAIDPEIAALLEQAEQAAPQRVTGEFAVTVEAQDKSVDYTVSVEGYRSGPDEALLYTTFKTLEADQKIAVAFYKGQVWTQTPTGEWVASPLGEKFIPNDLFDDPGTLVRLSYRDLLKLVGAQFTLSQQAYEDTEMKVLTVGADVVGMATLLPVEVTGESEEQANGRIEIVYWFNADNSIHHADLLMEVSTELAVPAKMTVKGTLFFEPWDQPVPWPAEVVASAEGGEASEGSEAGEGASEGTEAGDAAEGSEVGDGSEAGEGTEGSESGESGDASEGGESGESGDASEDGESGESGDASEGGQSGDGAGEEESGEESEGNE